MASALKAGDARMYAQKFIIRGIREGLSGNQILQNLRSVEIGGKTLGYRTQTFYQDYNRYLTAETPPKLTGLKSIPKDFSLNFSLPTPSTGGHRWLYPVTLHGTDLDTGNEITQNAAIVSPIPIDDVLLPFALQNEPWSENYNMQIEWDNTDIMQPIEFSSDFI